jgi:hypothetical protein
METVIIVLALLGMASFLAVAVLCDKMTTEEKKVLHKKKFTVVVCFEFPPCDPESQEAIVQDLTYDLLNEGYKATIEDAY